MKIGKKHIHIENFGPIKLADFDLKKFNVIIGPQSSGKSCILKISSFCTWVEKHIEIGQTLDDFKKEDSFIRQLKKFHKLSGYDKPDTFISYETPQMRFSYRKEEGFIFKWKSSRWNYRRPKVSYIPAERNLVGAIPDWAGIPFSKNNITDFMSDWNDARQNVRDIHVLNLGVYYHYNKSVNLDEIKTRGGTTIELSDASSGLQSLIPLLLYLHYITLNVYKEDSKGNFKERDINEQLPITLYRTLITDKGKDPKLPLIGKYGDPVSQGASKLFFKKIGKFNFQFASEKDAERIDDIYHNLIRNQRSDVFIEEPEENLFPPTQAQLINWIVDNNLENDSTFTIATHSPYVLTAFLERKDFKDFNLLFIPNFGEETILQTASKETIQEIFDYGVDAFFNIESLQ